MQMPPKQLSGFSWQCSDLNRDLVYSEMAGLYGAYFVVTGASLIKFALPSLHEKASKLNTH
jgi:hypothetical protein